MAFFLDSNVVLYGLGNEPDKKTVALALLAKNPYISTQVINECSHVLRRRLRWQPDKVAQELSVILDLVVLADVALEHIRQAWKIAARYGFSHYDSLIVASALAAKCDILYTEDLQHGQVVENTLTIYNPFPIVSASYTGYTG